MSKGMFSKVMNHVGDFFQRPSPCVAIARAEEEFGPGTIDAADSMSAEADTRIAYSLYHDAVPLIRRSLEIRLSAGGSNPVALVTDLEMLARCREAGPELDELFRRSVSELESAQGADSILTANALMLQGRYLNNSSRSSEATRALRQSIDVLKRSGDRNAPALLVRAMAELGISLMEQSKFAESEEVLLSAIRMPCAIDPGDSPALSALIVLKERTGRHEAAEKLRSLREDRQNRIPF